MWVGTDKAAMTKVLTGHLKDSRYDQDPLPVEQRSLDTPAVCQQFLKFQIETWRSEGGGLQYFGVLQKVP